MAKITNRTKTSTRGTQRTQKSAVQKPATKAKKPAAAKVKKSDAFAGTAQGAVARPAAQLPRSGWKDTEAFKQAAKAARVEQGDALAGGGRPVIRPLYGLPVPVPIDVNVKDKDIAKWAKTALGDRSITLAEVRRLIEVAKDNGGISRGEKRDLKRIIDQAGHLFDINALRELERFTRDTRPVDRTDPEPRPRPIIRPLYGLPVPVPLDISLRDKKLDQALPGILRDRKISLVDVDRLIDLTKDGRGLSKTERKDLERLLDEGGRFFDADAKDRLEGFLGRQPPIRPLYGLPFPFPGPQVSMMGPMGMGPGVRPASSLPTVELAHATEFVKRAKANGGLDDMEKSEMRALLSGGARFNADAKKLIEDYLRTQ